MKIIVVILAILICSCKENYHITERSSVVDLGKCTTEAVDSPSFVLGDGSAGDPYIICNINQLQLMNSGLTDHYQLGKDIDASATSTWITGTTGNGFIPIGGCNADYTNCTTSGASFTGSFDGCGYTINNLFINRTRGSVGLFGKAGASSVITNFRVTNANITGVDDVGGLVARLYNQLTDAYFSGTIDGNRRAGGAAGFSDGTITNIDTNVTVTCTNDRCGGAVGLNEGSITNTTSAGSVSGTHSTGGLVGRAYTFGSNITTSSSSVNVTGTTALGGLAGYNYFGTITKSFATGNVTSTSFNVGGFVGINYGYIRDTFATGNVIGTTLVGGHTGYGHTYSIERSFATGNVTGTGATNGAFIGDNDLPTLKDSFATGPVFGPAAPGSFRGLGAAGSNNHHSTNVSDFYVTSHAVYNLAAPPWDFSTVWFSPAPGTLPVLR